MNIATSSCPAFDKEGLKFTQLQMALLQILALKINENNPWQGVRPHCPNAASSEVLNAIRFWNLALDTMIYHSRNYAESGHLADRDRLTTELNNLVTI